MNIVHKNNLPKTVGVWHFADRQLLSLGATAPPPALFKEIRRLGVRQKLDFAFSHQGRTVAVEVEKANREKILRDILKCHQYLAAGADLALIVLPLNYPHSGGVWNLFDFGRQCYDQCRKFGFGTPELLSRILLLGFTQYCSTTQQELSTTTRQRMREEAHRHFEDHGGS